MECLTRVSSKSVGEEFQSSKSVFQECQVRSVKQECLTRVSSKKCQVRVSYKSVK